MFYSDAAALERCWPLPARRGARCRSTGEALASAGTLGSGSRVIGVWRAALGSTSAPLAGVAFYLHDVADPGNVGTVLRAAQAFGAGLVVLSPRTADPFGPKAVRASMGAIFGQPVARATFGTRRARPAARRSRWSRRGRGRCASSACRPRRCSCSAPSAPACPQEIVAACDEVAHVPVAGRRRVAQRRDDRDALPLRISCTPDA